MSWIEEPVFVTGATGFIGGRLCERLVLAGARRVRALVHSFPRAARIARLPIELVSGDLLDPASLQRALGSARIVIHCGLGDARAIVRGTQNLLELAEQAGVQRFIHMSTAAVYGMKPSPECEVEDAPLRTTGDVYCDNKLRAEKVVARFARRGFPVVTLRPSIVYGPFSQWSTRLIKDLRRGHVALIDEGKGACNTTHVDNLADAVFLALDRQKVIGEAFFITDGERVTWGDFIRAHTEMMDPRPALHSLSSSEIRRYYDQQPGLYSSSWRELRRLLVSVEFRKMLTQVPLFERPLTWLWVRTQGMPQERKDRLRTRLYGARDGTGRGQAKEFIPDLDTWATQSHRVFFCIDRARRILGYEPRVRFADGIRGVEEWLRFADYLGP
jgi:nucleoside-diphosphate-sugar epimerase